LGLRSASLKTLVGTFMLAICFHPLVVAFQQWVLNLYPLTVDTGQMQEVLHKIVDGSPGMWAILLLMAVAPAICEELAFRGFILNGLRQALKPVNAVLISAVLFGAMHGLLQQSIVAAMTGIILGFVALKTGSLWPCIVYHATHNALTLQLAFLDPETIARSKLLSFVLQPEINEQQQLVGVSYALLPATFMIICGVWIALNMRLRPGTEVIANAGQCLRGLKPNVNEATP
jgi:sodium transport system permease protein